MLRIHFTGADLVRTRVADAPDPLWETVLSLQMLRARYGTAVFGSWRGSVRDAVFSGGVRDLVQHLLFPLTPDAAYFPDFLTPPEGLLGLAAGIDAVRATSRARLRHETQRLAFPRGRPSWIDRLASGDRDLLAELGQALRTYHDIALGPWWDRMTDGVAAEHARRGRDQRTGGTAELLSGFAPMMTWQDPVLQMRYPVDRTVRLGGRGLLLIPSYFCWYHPVALADPALPPTIVYPVRPAEDFLGHHSALTADPALSKLIGPTRARILAATAGGASTTELARRIRMSKTTASQHAAVLREARLIASHRNANTVIHVLTPLGAALLGRQPSD